jgi:GNAT superfamily N-acetyltransferase
MSVVSHFHRIKHSSLSITLRLAREEEQEFLYQTYASARMDEIALYGWDSEQIENFLRFQFMARSQAYEYQYPCIEIYIIQNKDVPIGMFAAQVDEVEILGIDIALQPLWRNRGIGAAIIGQCFEMARQRSVPFRIHVERQNSRAFQLYERMGFHVIGGDPAYLKMEWRSGN